MFAQLIFGLKKIFMEKTHQTLGVAVNRSFEKRFLSTIVSAQTPILDETNV